MSYSFFDSHCHFDFPVFDEQRESLWSECYGRGVKQLLVPGVEPRQWQAAYSLTQAYQGIVMAAGLHPWYIDEHIDVDVLCQHSQWTDFLTRQACVAVGECGLDAMISCPLETQRIFFEAHLQMAADYTLPMIIHVRKTHNETLRLLQKYSLPRGGVIHGFTGSKELAMQYWKLGFCLGVGGGITYPRANKTREMVKAMPLESLLLETDAPGMPLNGSQGTLNSPLSVIQVAASLAELRQQPVGDVVRQLTENTERLFMRPSMISP